MMAYYLPPNNLEIALPIFANGFELLDVAFPALAVAFFAATPDALAVAFFAATPDALAVAFFAATPDALAVAFFAATPDALAVAFFAAVVELPAPVAFWASTDATEPEVANMTPMHMANENAKVYVFVCIRATA